MNEVLGWEDGAHYSRTKSGQPCWLPASESGNTPRRLAQKRRQTRPRVYHSARHSTGRPPPADLMPHHGKEQSWCAKPTAMVKHIATSKVCVSSR
jgi:hypothetical protein